MKKLFLFFLAVLIFISCKEQAKENNTIPKQVSQKPADDTRPAIPYTTFTGGLKKELNRLKQQKNIDSIRKFVHHAIAVDMPQYWKGTKWDFNGTTRTAGEEAIACGYFITTILEDIGLKLNRVDLAQEPSSVLIKSTCNKIKTCPGFEELTTYLDSSEDESVFIVGLDFHTGFIVKQGGQSYFFHSNYINRMGVVKELINESRALKNSKSFMIGNLTSNKDYLLK